VDANGSAQLTLGGPRRIVRASRSDVIGNVCYSFVTGKWLDTLRTELQEPMPLVSLDPYRAGASICQVLPRLSFSAEFNKSNTSYAFVTEMA